MKIEAKVIAHSKDHRGNELCTMIVTFPRYILAELNTHRMFSRNSASSRAIPFNKMVESVKNNPFIPIAWQKDHKGMQGTEYITDPNHLQNIIADWLEARDFAVEAATKLNNGFYNDGTDKVTKQICNRLLEPFMWHTVIITASEFSNFFAQRCPRYMWGEKEFYYSKKDMLKNHQDSNMGYATDIEWLKVNLGQADIHIRALAEAMWDAKNESSPKELKPGEWHIPFGDNINMEKLLDTIHKINGGHINNENDTINSLLKISTARCARISYTVVGEENKTSNYENDIKLHDRLIKDNHWSPFEHIAKCMTDVEYTVYINGFIGFNSKEVAPDNFGKYPYEGWCRNYRGFIQYRSLVD